MYMLAQRGLRGTFAVAILSCLAIATAAGQSYTLDWNSLSWTPGSTSQTFTNVDGSGVDVTVSISGGTFLGGYPRLSTDITGGGPAGQNYLMMLINESSSGNGATVSIQFSSDVESLSLGMFDVDTGTGGFYSRSFRDQITFADAPDSLTGSSANLVVNSTTVLGLYENANNSANGNVNASYSGARNNVTFFYGAGPFTQSNPAQQGISLSDMTFTYVSPIPEPSTYLIGAALLGLLGCDVWRRRRAKRQTR
ncbi:PEP-CTERM sorting domain-containing protein [Cerasicoccus frondis]|uniref:PEP-CTERM sorting domain-containing protein n=1 Tax=Cerasicoccus frondis TaxID=490090 RepID=UPI0028526C2A|nr:PEP-CTERM sorting domain-containing protein [Cerasicoccus frondis]